MMLSIFLYAYLPSMYLLWGNICSDLVPIFFFAVLGLRRYARVFSSCVKWGLLFCCGAQALEC